MAVHSFNAQECSMKKHLSNAVYGVLDYASYPIGMLLVAPIILHRVGAAEYGLWMVATGILSAGGIIASGFSDAAIQRIAALHGAEEPGETLSAIRTLFAINLMLGSVIGVLLWISAPWMARHLAHSHFIPRRECLACVRLASIGVVVRAVETVSVSAQRAFQEYRGTVQIGTATRFITLSLAAVLALEGGRTRSIMVVTVMILGAGTALQFLHLRRFISGSLRPEFCHSETRNMLRAGVFVWIQACSSVVFRQADRVLLGLSLGVGIVAPYALCVQFAEPLFGLTASGLSFFLPYLSGRFGMSSGLALRASVLKAVLCNVLFVAAGAILLLSFGTRLLQIWAGPGIAQSAAPILPLIVMGSALSGLSVTGTYAAQALGLFRSVALISIVSRTGLMLLMVYLLRHRGVQGLAAARFWYGAATLTLYLPLIGQLRSRPASERSLSIAAELQEGPEA
jgi:O-antigen/teichoic acid export membrane protein